MTASRKSRKNAPEPAPISTRRPPQEMRSDLMRPLAVACLALALYANTITHGYVMDDGIVITENAFTQRGIAGIPDILSNDAFIGYFGEEKNLVAGGRYRPLSIVTFAVEHELFGNNPLISHLVNILLYALTGVLILYVLRRLPGWTEGRASWTDIPFLAALVFIAHPLHTEVVANIKSRDEILGLMFALVSLYIAIRYVQAGKALHLILLAVFFLFALLSKENAIIFAVVIPVALMVFLRSRKKETLPVVATLCIVTTGFLVLRWAIVGGTPEANVTEVLNNAYVSATTEQKYATIAYTLGKYCALSVVPHPLTHDYYYNQIPLVGWTHPVALGSALLYGGLGVLVILGLKRKQIGAFGILIYLLGLSVVSNIVVPVGVTMAERFAYLPSLGISIAMAWLLPTTATFLAGRMNIRRNTVIIALAGVIVLSYSVKTIARNPAWKDNLTLFRTDVKTSPNSAKIRNAIGSELVIQALKEKDSTAKNLMLTEAIEHLARAVEIHPSYAEAWFSLGNAYFERDKAAQLAIDYYQRAIGLNLVDMTVHKNLGLVYKYVGQHEKAVNAFRRLVSIDTLKAGAYYHIGISYLEGSNVDSALANFFLALAIDSTNADVYNQIGIAYGRNLGDADASIRWMERAVALGVANYDIYQNLGIAYATKNVYPRAIELFQKAISEDPSQQEAYANLAVVYGLLGDSANAALFRQKSLQVGSSNRQE